MAFDFADITHRGRDDSDPAVSHQRPAPYPFTGNVISICVDMEKVDVDNLDESWYKGVVTELGPAWVDTQDLHNPAPGKPCTASTLSRSRVRKSGIIDKSIENWTVCCFKSSPRQPTTPDYLPPLKISLLSTSDLNTH